LDTISLKDLKDPAQVNPEGILIILAPGCANALPGVPVRHYISNLEEVESNLL
jgi:hypothetical protein